MLLIILLLLLLLSLGSVYISIVFHRLSEDDYLSINVVILRIIKLKYKIPTLDLVFNEKLKPGIRLHKKISSKTKKISESKSILSIENLKDSYVKFKKNFETYNKPLRYIIRKLKITYISWHTSIGVDDAAYTAVLSGLLWGIKCNIVNYLLKGKKHDEVDIYVTPNFSKPVFETDLNCIIRLQIANIIIGGVRILYILFYNTLFKKGGEDVERTSYSGVNEDYDG